MGEGAEGTHNSQQPMALADDMKRWARQQAAPVNVALIASLTIAALINWFLAGRPMSTLAFTGFGRPWGIVTYPWAYMPFLGFGLIGFIFLVMILLGTGGNMERELGSRRYALFLLAMTVIPALAMGLGGILFGGLRPLNDPWLPVSAILVAFAARNPGAPTMLYGILPITAKWLGVLVAAIIFFSYGFGNPLLGVFACLHLGVAYAFAAGKIPGLSWSQAYRPEKPSKAQREREDRFNDEVSRRRQEREERERLRKLFESSLRDDESK